MRRVRATGLLCLVFALVAPSAGGAFGTLNAFGGAGEHERITRAAFRTTFAAASLNALAGQTGSYGAVGAPDRYPSALFEQASAHCDNADFLALPGGYPQNDATAKAALTACRNWIVASTTAAVAAAEPLVSASGVIDTAQASLSPACPFDGTVTRAKCNTLEHFGRVLHASQDFYSHSNWVDGSGGTTLQNPPAPFNRTGRAPWLDLRTASAVPAGLITGCFTSVVLPSVCRQGESTTRVGHAVINKDFGDIDPVTGATSNPRTVRGQSGQNFAGAVGAAIDDSKDKWAYLEERLKQKYGAARGAKMACVLRSDTFGSC